MVKILLADDHTIIRTGLKTFIANYIAHADIHEAWDAASALVKIKETDYQLIVLDVNMPETDAFALVNNILAIKPKANILMFSMNAEEIYAKKFLLIGAKGYLSKAAPQREMELALDTVLKGEKYLSSKMKDTLTEEALGKKSLNPFDKLSVREFEIVMYLIKGKSLAEICGILHLHTSTVGTHKARIFEKLQCKNVIDLHTLAKVYNVLPSV